MYKTHQGQDQSKRKLLHVETYLTFYCRERGQPPIAWWTIKYILPTAGELSTAPRLPHGTSFLFPEMGERSLLIPVSPSRNWAWFVFMFYKYTNRELRPWSPLKKKTNNKKKSMWINSTKNSVKVCSVSLLASFQFCFQWFFLLFLKLCSPG